MLKRITFSVCLIFALAVNITKASAVEEERETVVNETLRVPAGELRVYPIEAKKYTTVAGRFDVQNARWADIWVLIIPTSEYDNFRNRRAYRYNYISGKVVSGNINVSLMQGSYLLIFSNLHSNIVDATVAARVEAITR